MVPLSRLRLAIEQVFLAWEAFPSEISTFSIQGVRDEKRDRYVLEHIDCESGRYQVRLLAHLEIRDGKIWVISDNTEEGIAVELVAAGIPKNQIVLAFYPQATREAGEFAVA